MVSPWRHNMKGWSVGQARRMGGLGEWRSRMGKIRRKYEKQQRALTKNKKSGKNAHDWIATNIWDIRKVLREEKVGWVVFLL